jgi:hypothetical protein
MRDVAQCNIEEWRQEFKNLSTVEIRVPHAAPDLEIASCASFDCLVVRLDRYDLYSLRSLAAVIAELASPQTIPLNFSSLLQRIFDGSWTHVYTLEQFVKPRWIHRRWLKVWVRPEFLTLGFVPGPIFAWAAVMIGISVAPTSAIHTKVKSSLIMRLSCENTLKSPREPAPLGCGPHRASPQVIRSAQSRS